MTLLPCSVGPIIGAMTDRSCRLWGRGLESVWHEKTNSPDCYAYARIKPWKRSNGEPIESEYESYLPIRLEEGADYTGTIDFENLEPDTTYKYQMGWSLTAPGQDDLQWANLQERTFRTASIQPNQSRTFVVGSCRYFRRLKRLPIFGKYISPFRTVSDRIFKQILDLPSPINRILMLGDQIYADDLNRFWVPDQTEQDFNRRYRLAFSTPHLRKLMAQTPTAMMLDDHEISDNWPIVFRNKKKVVSDQNDVLFKSAIKSFNHYQGSHSPASSQQAHESKRWYSFQDGCCDFFITDTRTERQIDPDSKHDKIMSDNQMKELKNWLSDKNDRVKIIASTTLIVPDAASSKAKKESNRSKYDLSNQSDQWSGFRSQQCELLEHIRENKIKPVIFLAGDVHASFAMKLSHLDEPDFQIISIVSSPFYWPFPHNQASSFQLSGRLHDAENDSSEAVLTNYFVNDSTEVISTDNFTQVTVSPHHIHIEIIPKQSGWKWGAQSVAVAKSYRL